jgi:hypothetical protein
MLYPVTVRKWTPSLPDAPTALAPSPVDRIIILENGVKHSSHEERVKWPRLETGEIGKRRDWKAARLERRQDWQSLFKSFLTPECASFSGPEA